MSNEEKIKFICNDFSELKNLDRKLDIFGASTHRYRLNERLSEGEINTFQEKHLLVLPEEYRLFLNRVGNGGAGPYYGLETLEDSLYADLDYKRPGEFVNPSEPFPFKQAWNMKFEGGVDCETAYKNYEKEYFSEKWETGILRICNYGCGASLNLVVNGQGKGNIWVDDRANDGGIYPDTYFGQTGKTNFLDWYLLWLELSLSRLRNV